MLKNLFTLSEISVLVVFCRSTYYLSHTMCLGQSKCVLKCVCLQQLRDSKLIISHNLVPGRSGLKGPFCATPDVQEVKTASSVVYYPIKPMDTETHDRGHDVKAKN